jgi:aspartate 1-decarboxylase
MVITLLKSKLHRVAVTGGHVDYEGSLAMDAGLADLAGFLEYERILVGNMANGERFETYIILAPRGSGDIVLNGATAHLGKPGDLLTIMSFAQIDAGQAAKHKPQIVKVGPGNKPVD